MEKLSKKNKKQVDERRLPWGAKEMRETDCQEVEKPADRDHDEGMDGEGLGMTCEKSRVGVGGGICSVYLLRSRMHDHNPAAVPWAFSSSLEPLCHPHPPPLPPPPTLCLPPSPCSLLDLCLCCRSSPFVPHCFLPLSLSCRNLCCVALLQSFRIWLRLH